MATSQMSGVIQHLRRAALLREGAGQTDGQLLTDYVSRHDGAALESLVRRHGPMVWGVCRRVLGNHHDAEDAFQATFLVLVRKAASIASRELLANWLYGVAHQTALKARATVARRKVRERQVTEMPEPAFEGRDLGNELQPLLDQELSRLPDGYRAVIVLCELEGKTRKEAARQLALPEGTVASRLARARAMLAKRLAQRGVTLSGGALAALLSQNVTSAGVSISLVSSTIRAATLVAVGQTAATGVISFEVAALTKGVLKAMLMSKLKAVIAIVLVLGFMVTGTTVLTFRTAAAEGDKPPTVEKKVYAPQKQEQEKEAFTAWGKEIGGLQAGLGFRPGEKRAYSHGETVTLVVRIRNVGKEEVKFQYLRQFFIETPPAVTDDKGKPVLLGKVDAGGLVHVPVDVNLVPGKEIDLYELKLELRPVKWLGNDGVSALYGTGKFQIQYERVFGNSSAGSFEIDPTLGKLATGKLELEIKTAPPKQEKEKEGVTAWGKEVDGLQAGIGFGPGAKKAYRVGEKVTLVVKFRNVSKKPITYSYLLTPFQYVVPTVRDSTGKPATVIEQAHVFYKPVSTKATLQPGEEVTLGPAGKAAELPASKVPGWYAMFALEPPAGDGGGDVPVVRVTPGKYMVGYAGLLQSHRSLSTGFTQFEVKTRDATDAKAPAADKKDAFTAWGKKVGGLQAGLGFRPGGRRAYHHGETARLVVRICNVGKKEVKFQYLRQFFIETPPTVTDGEGILVPPGKVDAGGSVHVPVDVNLPPGKGIDLYELKLELRPAKWLGNDVVSGLYGTGNFQRTGKVQIQYERILGDSSSGTIALDPNLGKLATGKLELELEPAPPAATGKK